MLNLRRFVIAQRFYAKVNINGIPEVPKKITQDRTLKAVKSWDRFPKDRLDKLNLDSRFQEDLSFDSLDQVEIVMSLEDEFKLEIDDNKMESFKTPRDVVDFICEQEMIKA